jgi:uncharacterized membrane protein YccC
MTKKTGSPALPPTTGGKATRPSDLLERTRRLATTPAQVERPLPESIPPAGDGKKTRLSVDLDDIQYEYLSIYAVKQKVRKVSVLRALLELLAEDPGLAEQVRRRLKE